ncbi:cell division protein FtsQ/DivIB [Pedosphaera parvula]|uniref:Polypeptide-transport-associated domain protein FtsQ-type n=1 Tax=Pedosphaera parvula (strain Ellin514) TaxID=320771 RepID=B9XIG3_PEDPL|nr:FtsQ-type POTRA domain-containing protein [Pedosphaera parvula]EEF60424.1 Polypeptide-transport-associated domain protein FtsQ-type [Pedosphaera parvula Ellin514]
MALLKRKPKNRRLNRDHVLDVKLRSDQVRATRIRISAIALGLVFATIFCLYVFWCTGTWALNALVYQNKAFAIQELDIQSDGVLAVEQLRIWAGVRTGQNLLALDLGQVKRDLEMASVIKSVAVERVLPHTLRLRVSEREPLAQIYVPVARTNGTGLDLGILHVDSDGYVMAVIDPKQRAAAAIQTNDVLPVISGINLNQLVPGKRLDLLQARSALQLVTAFERSPMQGMVELKKIDVSSPEILVVTTGQGTEVIFSTQDLDRQLRRWREIYDQGQKMTKAIATLDLSVPNNIPARWVEASSVPPVTPKTKFSQRNRRKNV